MMDSEVVERKKSQLAVFASPPQVKGMRLSCLQLVALLRKNYISRLRAWKSNLLLVAQAIVFVILTWLVDGAIRMSNQQRATYSSIKYPVPEKIMGIPDCSDNIFMRHGEPCYTLLYAPKGHQVSDSIIDAMAATNVPPIPKDRIRGFPNGSSINHYLLEHPNTVLATVEFDISSATNIGFSIQTNSSVQWFKGKFQDPNLYVQLPLQVAIEREASKILANQTTLKWTVDISQFPHPSAKSPSAIAKFAPTFLFASLMFQFVLQVYDIVQERESGSRKLMVLTGLKASPFWLSWIIFQGTLALVEACLLTSFAYAFRFDLFTRNDFLLSFFLLLGTAFAMMSFAFFVAGFLRKASSSIPIGFIIFVIAWIFLIVEGFGFPFQPKYSFVSRLSFAALPWNLLGKGIGDLANASNGVFGGLHWKDGRAYCSANIPSPEMRKKLSYWQANCVLPLADIYIYLFVETIVYITLAIIVDRIIVHDTGLVSFSQFFSNLMHFQSQKDVQRKRAERALERTSLDTFKDPDVREEANRMIKRCQAYKNAISCQESISDEQRYAIEIYGMTKNYRRSCIKAKGALAVNNLWLGIQKGECFCLLGPNGAGKTTIINCLTGVQSISEGESVVNGISVMDAKGLHSTRHAIGVCPQFDTGLWEFLSGKEHLQIFASLKGIPKTKRDQQVFRMLDEVKLNEAADATANTYSGGMKRRLSVGIALIGDPQIVFLDEPTTGLDPISRRHIWDLIDRSKVDRAIVMTTHSMEEADILGDRMGIIVRGTLRCLGTSLRLKSRFGSGYRVSIHISEVDDQKCTQEVKRKIQDLFQLHLGVEIGKESYQYLLFVVPYEQEDKLPFLLAYIKKHAGELLIDDLQLRMTPLEEVFLNVTRKAELENAEVEGKYEMLMIDEESLTIRVPVGANFIQTPSGNFYHVKWVQDESGELKIYNYSPDGYSNISTRYN